MAGTGCCVVLLVAHLAGNAEDLDARGNGVEHLGRCFGKAGDRCLTRDRVNGRFLWANALKRREPGGNVLLAGVVDELALILAAQKDRLDNNVTVKACERLNLVLDVVGANRLVEQLDKRRVDGIELKNVVVDHHERTVYLGAVGARAVGKHGNLGVWGKLVAQRDEGKAVLLVSLELDEVMDVPDRILVMYEGEIVGELDPKKTTQEELGLYMAGAKRDEVKA